MGDLSLVNLTKSYDNGQSYVLKNINLDIADGEFRRICRPFRLW